MGANNKEKKCVCGSKTFKLYENDDCGICKHNPAWFDDEWIYDEDIIKQHGLERDYVENEDQCEVGSAHGGGCNILYCSQCGLVKYNFPYGCV